MLIRVVESSQSYESTGWQSHTWKFNTNSRRHKQAIPAHPALSKCSKCTGLKEKIRNLVGKEKRFQIWINRHCNLQPNLGEQKLFPSRVWFIQFGCQISAARQLAHVKLFNLSANSIWSKRVSLVVCTVGTQSYIYIIFLLLINSQC